MPTRNLGKCSRCYLPPLVGNPGHAGAYLRTKWKIEIVDAILSFDVPFDFGVYYWENFRGYFKPRIESTLVCYPLINGEEVEVELAKYDEDDFTYTSNFWSKNGVWYSNDVVSVEGSLARRRIKQTPSESSVLNLGDIRDGDWALVIRQPPPKPDDPPQVVRFIANGIGLIDGTKARSHANINYSIYVRQYEIENVLVTFDKHIEVTIPQNYSGQFEYEEEHLVGGVVFENYVR